MDSYRTSFLDHEITQTQHRLAFAASIPPVGSWDFHILRELVLENRQAAFYLYGMKESRYILVEIMPMWFYFLYDRNIAFPYHSVWDPNTRLWNTIIDVPSIEHASDIEIPALQWVFTQMKNINNCVPPHDSMGQAILLYRALKLLHFDAAAAGLRQELLHEIKNTPLKAYDVQRIWWAFYGSAEWLDWLGEMLCNLIRHDVYSHSREGDFILYFLEGEILQLGEAEREEIQRIYLHYLNFTATPGSSIPIKAWWALGRAWGVVSCAPQLLKPRRQRAILE